MSGPSRGGWSSDPSGRFSQRYYDGANWTAHVVGANGQTVSDPLPPQHVPYPPPRIDTDRPAHQQPHQQAHQQAHQQPYPPSDAPAPPRLRYRPGVGLAVGLVGLLLTALDLLVLPWNDADDSTFLDIGSAVRDAGSDAVGDGLVYAYAAWAGLTLLVIVTALVAMACLPLPATSGGNTYARVAATVAAGTGALLHVYLVAPGYHADSPPGLVPLLGVIGFLVAGAGAALGARRVPG